MQYYELLNITRDADVPTIKKHYKIFAQKYHPSVRPDKRAEYERKFREITEAYDVLTNPKLRVIYDAYGEDGLKSGVPDGKGGMIGGGYAFSANPDEVFREAFGRNPFTEYFDFDGLSRSECADQYYDFAQMSIRPPAEKSPTERYDLKCTLDELYNGATLQVPLTRTIPSPDGVTTMEVTETQTIRLRPGMREGTLIRFPRAGSVTPGFEPADVIYTVRQSPHSHYRRDGDNLIFRASITLGEALTGAAVEVPLFDGRKISIRVSDIVCPGYVKVVPGEGMPKMTPPPKAPSPPNPLELVSTKPGILPTMQEMATQPAPPPASPESLLGTIRGRGDLLIEFDVKYPRILTPKQKEAVLAAGL